MARVVVAGASLAGLRAVESLRRGGWDDDITLIGAEPHLPYDRPPLSKQLLAAKCGVDDLALRRDGYGPLRLDLRLGVRATALDLATREITLDTGERVQFDGLVLATGAVPRQLPGTPPLEGIHELRTVDDSLAIRAALEAGGRLVVVGAGFIGAEVAATARRLGNEVTVLEALAVPLGRALGDEMGLALAGLHRDEGTRLRLSAGVAGFEGTHRVEGVRLTNGEVVDADVVVVGVGVRPATDWLEGSGLELRDGVVCDQTCAAVGADGVVAAGDLCRWENQLFGEEMRLEHWTNAAEQGDAAARTLLAQLTGSEPEPFSPVPYFWSDQYDAKIQFVGHVGPGDEVRVVHGSMEERKFVALYQRAGRLVGALAFSMPRVLIGYRRLLAEGATWDDAMAHAANV